MISKNSTYYLGLFVVLITYFKFFRPLGMSDVLLKGVYYVVLSILLFILLAGKSGFSNAKFNALFNALIINVFISVFMAFAFWDQAIGLTLTSSIPLFSFVIYKYLHKIKIKRFDVEKAIYLFTVMYTVCFVIALLIYPQKIFEGFGEEGKEIDVSRGFPRIRLTIMGAAPIFFVFFSSISKFRNEVSNKKNKVMWALLAVFMFLLIVLQLGRTSIVLSFLIGLLYITDHLKLSRRIFTAFFATIIFGYLVTEVSVFQKMTEETSNQYESNQHDDKNIRLQSYDFYFNDVSPNILTDFFGNGQYSLGNSSYGNYIDSKGRSKGFIPADVGFAHIYLILGYLGIIIFLFLFFSMLRLKVDRRYKYLKYYIAFLYLSNISGNTLLATIPLFCISFYLLDVGHLNYKRNKYVKKYNIRRISIQSA